MGIRPVKHIAYTLTGFYRRAQDFPHVLMMDDCDVAIFPSDSDHVPTLLSNNAAISGITMPVSACALLEVVRLGGRHDLSAYTFEFVRRVLNLNYAFGLALRRFFLSLSLLLLAPCLRRTVAISVLHAVIYFESHGLPFEIENFAIYYQVVSCCALCALLSQPVKRLLL